MAKVKKLTKKQHELLDFLQNYIKKSNKYVQQKDIVQNTTLSKQYVHVTLKKLDQLGLIYRERKKIYLKKVKKTSKKVNTTHVANPPQVMPKRNPALHNPSYKIKVTKHPKGFFEKFRWSKEPWQMKGQHVYYFEDEINKEFLHGDLKKYGHQNVFVKFYVRDRDNDCKMHVGFVDVRYDASISTKQCCDDFSLISYQYMQRFIKEYVYEMKLDRNSLVKTKTGHFKEFDLPDAFKNTHYEDTYGIIDDSDDDKPHLEYKDIEDAEFWTTYPKNFRELQDYIANSDKKQRDVLFKLAHNISERFEDICNHLEMNDTEMKVRHEIFKKEHDKNFI